MKSIFEGIVLRVVLQVAPGKMVNRMFILRLKAQSKYCSNCLFDTASK